MGSAGTKHQSGRRKSALSFEDTQRWVIAGMLFAVTLWIKINSVDSTVVKPHLLVLFSLLVLALFGVSVFSRRRLEWYPGGAEVPLVLMALILLASIGASDFRQFGIPALFQLACYGICFLAGSQLFRDERSTARLVTALVVLVVLVSIIALLQFVTDGFLGINFQLGATRRVMSTLGNASYLGGFLAMLIPIVLGQTMQRGPFRRRMLFGCVLVGMSAALLLTQSRSSVLAAFVACVLLVLLLKSSRPALFGGIAAGIFVVVAATGLLVPAVTTRLVDALSFDENVSFTRRVFFWEAGGRAALAAPLLGHGPGSHPLVIPLFRSPDYWMNGSEDVVPHAHNEFLEVAVELGFPGLVAYLVLIITIFWKSYGVLRSRPDWRKGFTAAVFCAWIAIIIDNLVGVSLRQPPVGMIAWLLAGAMLSHSSPAHPPFVRSVKGGMAGTLLTAIACTIAGVLYGQTALRMIDSDTRLLQGRMLEKAERLPQAAGILRQASAADPLNLVALLDEARVLLKINRPAEALASVQTLQRSAPGYPTASLLASLALLNMQRYEEASSAIEKELAQRSHPDSYFARFLIAERMNDTTLARQSLERILEQNLRAGSQLRIENALARLPQFLRTEDEIRSSLKLLEQCEQKFPANREIAAVRGELAERLDVVAAGKRGAVPP